MTNRSRHYHVAAFEQMVDDINAQGIEHVLCTGDVTNLALEQEFAFAREKFDRLAGGPTNVTVIPGNHDAYVAEGIRACSRSCSTSTDRPDPGLGVEDADERRRSALADRPRARRPRADRHLDVARDAVVHRVWPDRGRRSSSGSRRCSRIRGSPARRASSRSTIRRRASARRARSAGCATTKRSRA